MSMAVQSALVEAIMISAEIAQMPLGLALDGDENHDLPHRTIDKNPSRSLSSRHTFYLLDLSFPLSIASKIKRSPIAS